MKKLFLLIIPILLLCGCNDPQRECFYRYVDINDNEGILKYCGISFFSGKMTCMSGDYHFKVEVKSYEYFCEGEK